MVLDIPGLPSLSEGELYSCFFDDIQSAVSVQETTVTCFTPPAHMVPPVPHGQGRTLNQHSSGSLHSVVAVRSDVVGFTLRIHR